MQNDFEILEFTDLTIETTEMSVNRNAFMKWVDDYDLREYTDIDTTAIQDWSDYLSYSNQYLVRDIQRYISETFTRNKIIY